MFQHSSLRQVLTDILVVPALSGTGFVGLTSALLYGYVRVGKLLDDPKPGAGFPLIILFYATLALAFTSSTVLAIGLRRLLSGTNAGIAIALLLIGALVFLTMSFSSLVNSCYFGSGFPFEPSTSEC